MNPLQKQSPAFLAPSPHDTVRVVICGEVNSGKSTVLNALLRQKVLPDFFGETSRPYIFVTHGADVRRGIVAEDGTDETVDTFDESDLSTTTCCTVVSDQKHLSGFEIVEVPYLNEKHIPDDVADLIGSADILIWTTIASQAWRLSEKTILDKLPKRPARAVLTVSRADKLRSDSDRGRLFERLARETGEYFGDIVLFHGASRKIEEAFDSDVAWQSTAAPKLIKCLDALAEEVAEEKERHAEDETPVEAEVTPTETAPEETAHKDGSEAALLSETTRAELEKVIGALHGCTAMGVVSISDPDRVEMVHGSSVAWGGIGTYCATTIEVMGRIDPENCHEPLNSHLGTRGYQVLMQSFPRSDLCLFMIAATDRLSSSLARMGFMRVCRAFETTT